MLWWRFFEQCCCLRRLVKLLARDPFELTRAASSAKSEKTGSTAVRCAMSWSRRSSYLPSSLVEPRPVAQPSIPISKYKRLYPSCREVPSVCLAPRGCNLFPRGWTSCSSIMTFCHCYFFLSIEESCRLLSGTSGVRPLYQRTTVLVLKKKC